MMIISTVCISGKSSGEQMQAQSPEEMSVTGQRAQLPYWLLSFQMGLHTHTHVHTQYTQHSGQRQGPGNKNNSVFASVNMCWGSIFRCLFWGFCVHSLNSLQEELPS